MLGGAVVGITIVPVSLRWVAGTLIGVGATAFAIALARGYSYAPGEILSVNQTLIGMIAAVSFLQLITPPESSAQPRLSGRAAVWRTTGAVHLLGSVINMTVISSAGDHLSRSKVLSTSDALLISRAFSSGAFWSPFWAASAAALVYAPEARIPVVFVCGAALAFLAIAFSSESTARLLGSELRGYQGFALTRQVLQVPVVMVVLIVVIHFLAPGLAVAKLVLVCSVAITAVVLYVQDFAGATRKLANHAARHIPKYQGELTLFAAAGLLAVGLKAFLSVTAVTLPFSNFGVLEAWLCVVVMVALALIGVHPVVSIAALAAVVAQMDPDPTLFVMAAIIGWGCSVVVGPLSGLLIYINGRYGVNNLAIVRGNLPYVVFIVIAAYPCLLLCNRLIQS
ncbi:hypothetical protein [Cryobacterium sp. PH29-G1]|uniref:hypothetical protein n=1 Tax=Cryobacterium sp. PH29-G1 TaxID=3046211 RepID=UPI0024BBA754|nr:hypothetical protein [Cryobacterium sp. PH29-G1]MDJ0350740.1 hypothetical protein [Cryobacterium sp. PH29-G1]